MKNITIALILIFMISVSTLISGCIDKESVVNEIISSQSDIAYSGKGDFEALQLERNENLLNDIERFNDPLLKNVEVTINNPNIEVINLKLNDNREYESDPNWYVEIIVQNNAKTPVWISPALIGFTDKKYVEYFLLDSGKRKRYGFGGGQAEKKGVNLDYILTFGFQVEICAYDTVMPKISDDFVYSYRKIKYLSGDYYQPLLDFKSLRYEVNDRKWRYATFEVHNPSAFYLDASITMHIKGERSDYYESGDNRLIFLIKPGETKDVQISLRDYDPKDIRTINLQSNRAKESLDPYRFD